MNLYFDTDIAAFVSAPGSRDVLSALSFKRGDNVSLAVRFLASSAVVELTTGATGKLGIKESGKYDSAYLAAAPTWTKTGTGTDTVYTFDLNLATTELAAALNDDGTEDNDIASIDAMLEMEYVVGDVVTSSNTITATIHNDVIKGDEDTPTPLPSPIGSTIPSNGSVNITGTLTSDGTTAVTFGVLDYAGDSGGKPSYSSGAKSVAWVEPEWVLTSETPAAQWKSSEDVATPDLVETWTPQTTVGVGTATGAPSIALTAPDQAPPYLYVNDGFLYVQDAGYWKNCALTFP